MDNNSFRRSLLVFSTGIFLLWAFALTLFWPIEDYADVAHAYAESTNQIVRGMSIGVSLYLSVIVLVVGWSATKKQTPGKETPTAG